MTDILSTGGLTKSYGGVPALSDVSFTLRAGEIRAICGENGAGKSTFVKMLLGIVKPDAGTIAVENVVRDVRGPHHAQSLGLGLVAQELSLAPHLSILDNIWLGSGGVPFWHRREALRTRAQKAMALLGIGDWDLDRLVMRLTIAQRQLVEIAKLLARDARILILDEPSATLSDIEIARLMDVLRLLRARGRSIIYITHRLGEVFDVCDSVTVFRNGMHVATGPVTTFSRETLIERMLGRAFADMYPERTRSAPAVEGLRVKGMSVPGTVQGLSFTAPRGRILCIAGQVGSGATSVTRAIAGLAEAATGEMVLDGQALPLGSRAAAEEIVFVTEDRAGEGVFLGLRVLDNLVATRLAEQCRFGVVSWPALRVVARRLADHVAVAQSRLQLRAEQLSGGNQQKIIFARAVERKRPGVLVMNEPTRGVDVGARAEIYRLMRRLADDGACLIMASSDLEEVVGMADIVVTLFRGRVVGHYEGDEVTMPTILRDIAHPDLAAA